MRREERDIEEKRLIRVTHFFDITARLIAVNIGGILAFVIYRHTVFLEVMTTRHSVIEIENVRIKVAIEMVKAARIGRVLFYRMAQMPFTDHRGLITCVLEILRHEALGR